jgi:hypothetical protein
MDFIKLFELSKSVWNWLRGYYKNQETVRKELEDIISKKQSILELMDNGNPYEKECNELKDLLAKCLEKLESINSLYPNENEDRVRRENLSTILSSSKTHLEGTITTAMLRKYLEELEQVANKIHLPHPLPSVTTSTTKMQWLLYGLTFLGVTGILSLVLIDQLLVTPGMKKDCNETPGYRSNELLAGQFSMYRNIVEESHMMSGNTCISSYNKNKNKHHLDNAEKVFLKLRSINEKSLQATFFLEYISKKHNSTSTEYNRSILLAKEYANDKNSKNYVVRKEDFDILIKIGHILEGKQDYDTAYKLYDLILSQEGHDKHLNALLGICTTHLKMDAQKEPISRILDKCEKSLEVFKEQQSVVDEKKSEKQALAHYNYGCLLIRLKNYSDAEKQFILGEEKDGSNLNIKRAVSFSKLLKRDYEGTRKFINDVISESDKDINSDATGSNKDFYRDIQMGLGIAYLGLAEGSDNEKDKLDYYKQAYINIENSRDKMVGEMYLKKIGDCKNKFGKECSSIRLFENKKEDSKLLNHIHNKFWAFINHYQISKNIADAKVKIDIGDNEKLKGRACNILTK